MGKYFWDALKKTQAITYRIYEDTEITAPPKYNDVTVTPYTGSVTDSEENREQEKGPH